MRQSGRHFEVVFNFLGHHFSPIVLSESVSSSLILVRGAPKGVGKGSGAQLNSFRKFRRDLSDVLVWLGVRWRRVARVRSRVQNYKLPITNVRARLTDLEANATSAGSTVLRLALARPPRRAGCTARAVGKT